MTLDTATYSAYRGFSWSAVPPCVSARKLNQFYRTISAARGDFPDPTCVDLGLVSDGKVAAAFTVQNVPNWDADNRASLYAALAFFPATHGADVDFIDLINNDFFWTPSRQPTATLEYTGPTAAAIPAAAARQLQLKCEYLLRDPRAIGSILAKYGARSSRWTCLMKAENILKIECNRWS